jgi:hypothetical protein
MGVCTQCSIVKTLRSWIRLLQPAAQQRGGLVSADLLRVTSISSLLTKAVRQVIWIGVAAVVGSIAAS